MDFSGHKDFLQRTLSDESLFSTGQYSFTEEPKHKGFDGNEDPEQEHLKSRTVLDSSWSYCGISAPQSKCKGVCKSLQADFNQTVGSEARSAMSQTLQKQYWACAIPKCLPPRPDRSSSSWDPNKEYQDLLDYSYPLNPKYCLNKDDKADALLHDSGVDIGSYNLSCESKFSSSGSPYLQDHKPKTNSFSHTSRLKSPYAFSTPFCKTSGYRNSSESNLSAFGDASPYTSKGDFAKESSTSYSFPRYSVCDKFMFTGGPGERLQGADWFLSPTRVLPLQGDLDTDEDYLSLPPTLKELETLASHLKDLSLSVGQAEKAESRNDKQVKACEQLRCLSGIGSSTNKAVEDDFRDLSYGSDLSACRNHHEFDVKRFSTLRDMLDSGDSFLRISEHSSVQKVQENTSLVQRIQRFCLLVDKLIQWLYNVAEITGNWTAPKPNVESIQMSLSLYQKLKKDVAEQQTLAEAIMKDGESLVKCMDVNSSVLKDTLVLISKQSGELERHTERLYVSVLEAMDTITDKGLGRSSNPKQPVSLESS